MNPLLRDFRTHVLGSWLNVRIFLRDRRRLLRYPRATLRRSHRALNNRPFQFAVHALIVPAIATWCLETLAITFLQLPPTSVELSIVELDRNAERNEQRGREMLAESELELSDVPSWIIGLDSLGFQELDARLRGQVDSLGASFPDMSGLRLREVRLGHLQQVLLDSIGEDLTTMPRYMAARDSQTVAFEARIEALRRSNEVLRYLRASYDSLAVVQAMQLGGARGENGELRIETARLQRQTRARQIAGLKIDAAFQRLSAIFIGITLLMNGLVFTWFIRIFFPSAVRDPSGLFLYFLSACLVGPNMVGVGVIFMDDLAQRYQASEDILFAVRIIAVAIVVWSAIALYRAAQLITKVVQDHDPRRKKQATEIRVMGAIVGSLIITTVALGLVLSVLAWPVEEFLIRTALT